MHSPHSPLQMNSFTAHIAFLAANQLRFGKVETRPLHYASSWFGFCIHFKENHNYVGKNNNPAGSLTTLE